MTPSPLVIQLTAVEVHAGVAWGQIANLEPSFTVLGVLFVVVGNGRGA